MSTPSLNFAQFVTKLDARISEWAKRPEEIERAISAEVAQWSRGDRTCRVRPAREGVVDYGIGLAVKGEIAFDPRSKPSLQTRPSTGSCPTSGPISAGCPIDGKGERPVCSSHYRWAVLRGLHSCLTCRRPASSTITSSLASGIAPFTRRSSAPLRARPRAAPGRSARCAGSRRPAPPPERARARRRGGAASPGSS